MKEPRFWEIVGGNLLPLKASTEAIDSSYRFKLNHVMRREFNG
ncbi:hypothetical protein HanXRQr2_Chr14g0636211 [Helianthus annuus]|uniref:Uncharacterized protein n=1 Tax=Helianthus annuus TaxID=4232 RepID=A0A9K3H727_HELAN|nr:hypothetical protein HanXRQr2_Chr14g0636211 [Helianthus annuus]KAJ0839720.1 hypothetical protein HanPSC8_Chr14g0610201 [Helianthus annuus]